VKEGREGGEVKGVKEVKKWSEVSEGREGGEVKGVKDVKAAKKTRARLVKEGKEGTEVK
jgi:hypothetical protein